MATKLFGGMESLSYKEIMRIIHLRKRRLQGQFIVAFQYLKDFQESWKRTLDKDRAR